MKRILSYAFLILSHLIAQGQADRMLNIPENALSWYNPVENTDSLISMVPLLSGRQKVDALCELSYALRRAGAAYDHAFNHAQEALELAKSIQYKKGIVTSKFLIGSYHRRQDVDTLGSLRILLEAEKHFDPSIHWSLKQRIWLEIGMRYRLIRENDSAVLYYNKSPRQLDEETAWLAHIQSLIWLMRDASIRNRHAEKINYMNRALQVIEQYPSYYSLVSHNLYLHEELCINLANDGKYRKANNLLMKAADTLFKMTERKYVVDFYLAKFLGRIARNFSYWGKYDAAFVFFDSSLQYFDRIFAEHQHELLLPENANRYRAWSINMANQLEEKAVVLIKTAKYIEAEELLTQSIEIRTKHNDPLGVAMCYDKLGELYKLQGRFMDGLSQYNAAINIKLEFIESRYRIWQGFTANQLLYSRESLAVTYLKIGRLYEVWESPHLALEFISKSLAASHETGSQKSEAEALIAYGDIYLALNLADSSLFYYQKAESIYEIMENRPGLAAVNESLGDYFSAHADHDQALYRYGRSQQKFEELEMPRDVARIYLKQGNVSLNNNNMHEALAKFESALLLAAGLNLPKLEMEYHHKLSVIYTSLDDYKQAFWHSERFHEIKDELFSLEISQYLAEAETRFETEKHKQEVLQVLSDQQILQDREARIRTLLLSLLVLVVVLTLWILLYIRHHRLKTGHEKVQLQQRLFRSQMNPHFIFNSLGSIQHSILSNEPDKAIRYLARFSKLMRSILNSSTKELVSVAEDLSTIENYLTLQIVRFPNKFDYRIIVDNKIDINSTFIPPMLVQPFIENAIEHGIMHKKSKGSLQIRYQRRNGMLHIEVEDDGVGRKKAMEIFAQRDKTHNGMATNITRERIDLLNRSGRKKMTFEIVDLSGAKGEATGTKVVFEVPM
jgi:tetratricopeptide (TPR) repeat protein